MSVIALAVTLAVLGWLGAAPWVSVPARVTWRAERHAPGGGRPVPDLGLPLLLDLLGAAVEAGADLPRACESVGAAVAGTDGSRLQQAGAALRLGATWEQAWAGASPRLSALATVVGPSWASGQAAAPSLSRAAAQHRHTRRRAAQEAAGRLGVWMILPLGLCYLPSFVLLGLLPVVVSLGADLFAPLVVLP